MKSKKIAIITGASSGIGLRCAHLLESQGYKIYNLSRTAAESETIINITLDISETEKLLSAVNSIYMNEKKIDVLINCAGYSIASPLEKTMLTDYRYLFDVNFFGGIETIKAVLPYMRAQKYGRIVNISSVAGIIPIPFQSMYCCSKAALNMLSLVLNTEVNKYGIKVASLMPGGTKTPFTKKRKVYSKDLSENYDANVIASAEKIGKSEQEGMLPEKVAKKAYKLILQKNPKPISTVGITNNLLLFAQRLIPFKILVKFLIKKFKVKSKTEKL